MRSALLRLLPTLFALAVLLTATAAAGDSSCTADAPDSGPASRYLPATVPFTVPPSAVDPQALPANKRTQAGLYLSAVEAGILSDAIGDRMLFVDVRTRGELVFNGMATTVDAHVPILLDPLNAQWDAGKGAYQLERNPDFVAAVDRRLAQKSLTRDDIIVLICQGGVRAASAADVLTKAGHSRVYSVVDGFEGDPATDGPQKGQRIVNGWRNAGLPWTTRLDRAKMYGEN
jgi:rhodanese-related sulfurtransferase